MPSGWQSFPVDVCPVYRRPYNPFLHLCSPTYHMLMYHISSAAVSIPVVLHLRHRARPPMSSQLTLAAIPTSHVSVAALIAFSFIVPCTLPLFFVYLLQSDILFALRRSILHCLICYDPHWFSHSPIWSSRYTFLFSFGTALLSLYDVLALLLSATFFTTWLHSALLQSDNSPHICLIWYDLSISDILNSDSSAHALIYLLLSAWIILIRYDLSFVPLDLLIYLKITHHCVTHHLLLAYTII